MSSVGMIGELTEDIWRWTARHPEWLKGNDPWTHEVASFAVAAGDDLVLVDPQAPSDAGAFWSELSTGAGAATGTRSACCPWPSSTSTSCS